MSKRTSLFVFAGLVALATAAAWASRSPTLDIHRPCCRGPGPQDIRAYFIEIPPETTELTFLEEVDGIHGFVVTDVYSRNNDVTLEWFEISAEGTIEVFRSGPQISFQAGIPIRAGSLVRWEFFESSILRTVTISGYVY